MAQAALAFALEFADTLPGRAASPFSTRFERTGFEIGRDHARYGLTPPADQMLFGHPVRAGWDAGVPAFRRRTRRATTPVHQWLELRLQAWLRSAAFEDIQVTPHLLSQIAAAQCPVTGERLTQGTGHPSDAVIERLNPQAAYAAGNLVAMSRRAQAARAGRDWHAALAQAHRIEGGEAEAIDGLTAEQWRRLAVLASFATPLSHDEAAALPLAVLPPNRVRVINPVQALQVVLTLPFTRADALPLLAPMAALVPAHARPAFHVFMTTLLSRRVAGGQPWNGAAMAQAMQQAWADPLVLRRWQRLALALTAAEAERLVQQLTARGLGGESVRCLDFMQATDGWGLADAPAALRVAAVASRPAGSAVATRARGPVPRLAPAATGGSAAHRVE
ncbi:hypothetical protein V4F39_16510 [Aquincola sp. MAHUQ-54]|uniref:Uncharacterized protein n=1 Tax=Aquincola agrisoli TaxID=3119538 RepID=A0AAW9Q8E5_9BURK